MKTFHKGFVIETFQQFAGAWICRYEGIESGNLGARTQRQGIAKCKAEILHIRRGRRIAQAPAAYWDRLSRRYRRRYMQQVAA